MTPRTMNSDKPLGPHWPQLMAIFKRHNIDLVLDIGANKGQYASYLRRAGYDGRIVSFEPLADAHATLVDAAADDPGWTIAERVALGAAPGQATLHVSAESDMSSLKPITDAALEFTPSSRMVGAETVPVERLDARFDEYCNADEHIFVKIDTQGSELPILDGATDVIDRIAGWQLELSLVEIYQGEAGWRAVTDQMAMLGFAPHLIVPGYFSRHAGRMLQFDAVFFRE